MIDFKYLHVGLTNRCRLLCLECTRTAPNNKYIHSMFDINTEHFKNFILSCKPNEVFFCGNWGDPIYAEDFLGLLAGIKTELPDTRIVLHTNGSGKSTAWWEQFASLLTDIDVICFSIDGTPENYATYRVNSKWDDVENAVKTCISTRDKLGLKTKYVWKHLVFSYNENTIIDAYNKSKELGLEFQLQESMVFGTMEHTPVGGGTWLRISKPFSEIEKEFNEQKNRSVL